MESNIQRMFAYQEIMNRRGKESICHSAILKCEFGSQECILNLQKSHGKCLTLWPKVITIYRMTSCLNMPVSTPPSRHGGVARKYTVLHRRWNKCFIIRWKTVSCR